MPGYSYPAPQHNVRYAYWWDISAFRQAAWNSRYAGNRQSRPTGDRDRQNLSSRQYKHIQVLRGSKSGASIKQYAQNPTPANRRMINERIPTMRVCFRIFFFSILYIVCCISEPATKIISFSRMPYLFLTYSKHCNREEKSVHFCRIENLWLPIMCKNKSFFF